MRKLEDLSDSPHRAYKTREALRGVARDHEWQRGVDGMAVATATPGKATLTGALGAMGMADPLVQVHRTMASAACDAANLEEANRTGDFPRASWAKSGLKRFIAQAPLLLAMVPRGAGGELAEMISALVQRARAALDNGPKISPAAMEAAERGDYARMTEDLAPWRAKAEVAATAEPADGRPPLRGIVGLIGGRRRHTPAVAATPTLARGATSAASPGAAAPLAGADPVHDVAAQGIAGGGEALPHGHAIAASFGPEFDISGLRAHIGGSAARASEALGAHAYATGNDVAFSSAPDLHTAAHEATHAVLQLRGIAPAGGVGKTSDALERHADAVADAVVAGRPAAPLLAQMARGANASSPRAAAVQLKEKPGAAKTFANGVRRLDRSQLVFLGTSNPKLWNWVKVEKPDATRAEVAALLIDELPLAIKGNGDGSTWAWAVMPRSNRQFRIHSGLALQLPELVQYRVSKVDQPSKTNEATASSHRDIPARRQPTALEAVLVINEARTRDAVAAQLRDYGWPEPAEHVHFAPNGERLFSKRLYMQVKEKLASAASLQPLVTPGDLEEELDRLVDLRRGGDASAFGKSVAQLVQWAARDALVERVGPAYSRVWSKTQQPPAAHELAVNHPMDALVAVALTTPGVIDPQEMPELDAPAPIAFKTARAQPAKAPGVATRPKVAPPPTVKQLLDIESDIGKRLDSIHALVAPLGFGTPLHAATDARAERVQRLADADAATLAHYLPILQFQHTQLITISGAMTPLVAQYWPLHGLPDFALTAAKRRDREQLQWQLSQYVRAAAISDQTAQSTAIVKDIEVRKRHQSRRNFDAVQRDAELETKQMIASTAAASPVGTAEGLDVVARQRQAMLDGTPKGRSAYERIKAMTLGGELALNARIQTAEHALEQLRQAAIAVYGDEQTAADDIAPLRSLPWVVRDVQDHLAEVRRTWDHEIQKGSVEVQEDPNAPDDWSDWKARAAALPIAQQAFARIAGDKDLVTFFEKAKKEIRHQQIVNAVVQLATALLITLATGMGAAMLGEQVALAIAAEGSGLGARAVALGVNLAVNATINTAVQLAISQPTRNRTFDSNGKAIEESDGAMVGSMLLENMLMDMFTKAISAPLRQMQTLAMEEGKVIATLPHLSKSEANALSSFKFAGADIAIEFVGGMSAQWAAHHLVQTFRDRDDEVSEPFALTALQQGAAIGLGKFFHGQLAAWQQHRRTLEHLPIGRSEAAQRLFLERAEFYKRAKELRDSLSPDPSDLHALLDHNEALIRKEHALLAKNFAEEVAAARNSAEIDDLAAQHVAGLNQRNEKILTSYEQARQGHKERLEHNPRAAEPPDTQALLNTHRANARSARELAMAAFADDPHVARTADGTQQMRGDRERERANIARSADLPVKVDASDPSAHKTTIGHGSEEVRMAQQRRSGRIAEAEAPADDAALARVHRAAERIARENLARVHKATEAASALPHLEVGHLQEGYGPQGAMNLGVQTPAAGGMKTYDRVVIASVARPSVMFSRGDQKIGQPAHPLDSPGLPARATTRAQDTGFMTSQELAHAKELGQAQIQATVLDGEIVGKVQTREDAPPVDWSVAKKKSRVRVRFENGQERWVYFDAYDSLSGAGPGRDAPVRAVTAEATFDAGKKDGTIADAADPALRAHIAKLPPDATIVVLGGGPSSDWAAEFGVGRRARVIVLGDVHPANRADWVKQIADARATGGDAASAAKRAEMEKAAHPGQAIPRNQGPGTAGDHPDIVLTTGTPTEMTRRADGQYHIEQRDIATGAASTALDAHMIIYGYGQSKAPHLEERFGPAPPDGMLAPIYYDDTFVGLRDPKTGTTLRGAAAVNIDVEPWVKASERARWKTATNPPEAGTELYNGKTLSKDSAGVRDGMEIGADRIQRGAVLDALEGYKLPEGVELDIGQLGGELEAVRKFVVDQVPAAPIDKIKLHPFTDGKTGDSVFRVEIDGKPLGVVKLFQRGAGNEKLALKVLGGMDLQSLRVPRDRGVMNVARDGVPQSGPQVQLTDHMAGESIRDIAMEVMGKTGKDRDDAVDKVTAAESRAAQGLAELHAKTTNSEITVEGKRAGRASDADHLLSKIDPTNPEATAKVAKLGGEVNATRILAKARAWAQQFKARTDSPAAAYLGDANISNMKVSDYDSVDKVYKSAATFDAETHRYGYANGEPMGEQPMGDKPAAAADLARLVGSLETRLPPEMFTPVELGKIKNAVIEAYVDAYEVSLKDRSARDPAFDATQYRLDPDALRADMDWYRLELEIAAVDTDPGALQRIATLLGIPLDGTTGRK